jgi:hypothetical protein
MIDFGLCRNCDYCGDWAPGEVTDTGEVGVRPSVRCELSGDLLLMNSDAPRGCPYALEHKLVTQDVPVAFADHMSGCRRSSEAEF